MPVRISPVITVLLLSAGAASALGGPVGAPLGPMTDVGQVPNGDLASGLLGWGVAVGPASSMVLGDGPIISASDNVTVLTPSFVVPADGQVVAVSLGAPGANTVVDVRARPDDGGPEVPLTTVVPARGVASFDIPVGTLAGRSVRLVLDPTMSIGRRIVIGGVGPVRSLLPGWTLSGAQASVVTTWGRTALRVQEGTLAATTPVVTLGSGTHYLGFAVRGAGSVTAGAGGRRVRAAATGGTWTWAYAPVPRGRTSARLTLSAITPAGQSLAIGPVATPARALLLRNVVAQGGVVRAQVGPGATGLRVVVTVAGRTVGTGRVNGAGAVTVRVPSSGRATLQVIGDASRVGVSRAVRLG